tara:strand:+ start:445 stop:627 length:183 start_codon:yes stop_codon:yes gene_type:complete
MKGHGPKDRVTKPNIDIGHLFDSKSELFTDLKNLGKKMAENGGKMAEMAEIMGFFLIFVC